MLQEVQEGEKDEEKEKEKKKEVEPNLQLLENPARVMPAQLKVLTMPETCRYQPFKPVTVAPCLSVAVCKETGDDQELRSIKPGVLPELFLELGHLPSSFTKKLFGSLHGIKKNTILG